MAVTRADKETELQTLEGVFQESDAAILIDYKGINVPQVTELRAQLRKAKAGYKVVKNTLAKRALKGTDYESLSTHFEGTTAVAYTEDDPVALAKTLTTFMKSAARAANQGRGGAGPGDSASAGDRTREHAGQARALREVAVCAAGADGQPGTGAQRRAA